MANLLIENGSEHPMLSREFVPKKIIDQRTPTEIVIDSIGAQALIYVKEETQNNGEIDTSLAWDYAGELYDSLIANLEPPVIDGVIISRHRYQAVFMLAFEIEQIARFIERELGVTSLTFIRQAETIALNELNS